MSVKHALAGARFRIPEPYRHVNAPRRKDPAVGRKGHRKDIRAAESLKKIVLVLGPWPGLLALKALTYGLLVCADRSPLSGPKAVLYCHHCRTQ
jgi:hypothetical protein